jgi:NitT/TauT family transport system substrate-binding protein
MVKSILALCVLLLVAAGTGAAATPAGVPARIVLAVDGIEQPRNLPALLAERLGYFREAGVTVTLVDAPADPSPAKLMADGRADGAIAYFHHTFMSQVEDGAVTRAVVTLGLAPGERLMVASRLRGRVHSIGDLKGMKIITGGPNSGKTTATTWAFLHAGLRARDYVSLPLVPREAAAQELADGTADAIMAHEPDASFYQSTGAAFQLLDLATAEGTIAALGTVYPSTALYMPEAFIDAHPAEVRALASALLRSLAFIENHDAAAIVAALPPKAGGADRQAFIRQIAADRQMFGGDGHTDPAAATGELRAMTALNPNYARVRIADTWSNDFLPRSQSR